MREVPESMAAVIEVDEMRFPSMAIPSLLTLQYPRFETGT